MGMGLIAGLIFVGVFMIIALPLLAFGSSSNAKQTLATLDSVLKGESLEERRQKVDLRKDEKLSSIPWLNRQLRNLGLAPYLRRTLAQAALNWSPGRLILMTLVCFAVPLYVTYLVYQSDLLSLAAGLLLGSVPFVWVQLKRRRRLQAFEKNLPEALDLMVSGLRAGQSLIAAMALVARECSEPVGSEFKLCFEEQNYGLEMKAALDNLLERVPLQDLKIAVTAIIVQKESGGNLAEVLDKTAYVIRERFRLKRQIKVHTAQGRLTGLILAVLPIAVGIGMYFLDPEMISILWHRAIGIKLMWVAAVMMVIGGLVIRKIVDIDV